MPKGSGGAGSLMPSCVNRCSAVTGRELSSFKIFSFGPVFIDSLLQFRLIVRVLIFHGVPLKAADMDAQRPTKSPKRFSASPGLQKPLSNSVLILRCVAGRPIEAIQAFHPDSISISGGKLAMSTRRLVSVIVCLSQNACRKQGQAHFPYPWPARESTLSTPQMYDSGAPAFRAMDASLWVQEGGAPNRQALQENLDESEKNLQRHCQRQPP